MENQDDPKDDSTESASDDSSSPEAAEAGDARPRRAPGSKSSKGAKKRASARGSSDASPAKAPAFGVSSGLVVAGLLALAVGAAGGWFAHEAKAKKDKLRVDSAAPAPSGSAAANGPCSTWATKVCAGTGEQSAACGAAKGALDLLTPPTCEVALAGVPATLAKVKAGRASCDTLSARLCKDLPPGSGACNIVKERTPSFPSARCDEMLQHYDDVIQELRQLDQQQGMMGMAPPGAAPPGAGPMAPPPGAAPHP